MNTNTQLSLLHSLTFWSFSTSVVPPKKLGVRSPGAPLSSKVSWWGERNLSLLKGCQWSFLALLADLLGWFLLGSLFFLRTSAGCCLFFCLEVLLWQAAWNLGIFGPQLLHRAANVIGPGPPAGPQVDQKPFGRWNPQTKMHFSQKFGHFLQHLATFCRCTLCCICSTGVLSRPSTSGGYRWTLMALSGSFGWNCRTDFGPKAQHKPGCVFLVIFCFGP